MNETREVLGVWTFEGKHKARNRDHQQRREQYIYGHFGGAGKTPAFIWQVEFFRTIATPRSSPERYEYGFTLHRYASRNGRRYHTWVKAYDEHGHAVSTKLAALVEPENYRIQDSSNLPPEWLLLNQPLPE